MLFFLKGSHEKVTGLHKFTFWAPNFTCPPDQAHKRWVCKNKGQVKSKKQLGTLLFVLY